MRSSFLFPSLMLTSLISAPACGQSISEAAARDFAASASFNAQNDDDDDEAGAGPHGFLAIGPGLVPAYEGSDKYELVPLVIANVNWKGLGLEVRGLGAKIDLLGASPIDIGPLVNFEGSRKSRKDGRGRVKLLSDVASSIEVGGHLGYRFGGNQFGQGEIAVSVSAAKDMGDGHDGTVGSVQASYAAFRSSRMFVNFDTQATFADKKYMRAFFGVSSEEARRSGLQAYRPGSGIKDAGAGITAGYQFSPRWGLLARAGANYYLGDAKDSPIADEGSKLQAIGGLAVSFRF